jgi:uncharacterized membrane protein
MSKREIAALALRLLGIYCLVTALPYISALGVPFGTGLPLQERVGAILGVYVPFGTWIIVGLLLLVYAHHLGRWLVSGESEQPLSERWTSRQIQAIAFSVAGIYLLAVSLPDLCMFVVQAIAAYIAVSGMPKAQVQAVMQQQGAHVIASLLRTALGLWLFLGAKGWSNLWHRLHPTMGPAFEATPDRHNTE